MSFYITSSCATECATGSRDCVSVCPVGCIYKKPVLLETLETFNKPKPQNQPTVYAMVVAIDSDRCIDCGYCAEVCREHAIVSEDEIP